MDDSNTCTELKQGRLEKILSQDVFEGLKAILDRLSPGQESIVEFVRNANCYEDLLAALGYKVVLTKQIHVNDCYNRMSQAGGIKAVLPYYEISTQSSFPTLVNYDGTVTTTPKAAAFFNGIFSKLKRELSCAKSEAVPGSRTKPS